MAVVVVAVVAVVPRDTEIAQRVALAAVGLGDTRRCGARGHRAMAVVDAEYAPGCLDIPTAFAADAVPGACRTVSIPPEPSVSAASAVSRERIGVVVWTVVSSAFASALKGVRTSAVVSSHRVAAEASARADDRATLGAVDPERMVVVAECCSGDREDPRLVAPAVPIADAVVIAAAWVAGVARTLAPDAAAAVRDPREKSRHACSASAVAAAAEEEMLYFRASAAAVLHENNFAVVVVEVEEAAAVVVETASCCCGLRHSQQHWKRRARKGHRIPTKNLENFCCGRRNDAIIVKPKKICPSGYNTRTVIKHDDD